MNGMHRPSKIEANIARPWSAFEERAHAISHAAGASLALIGGCFLVNRMVETGDPTRILAAAIFSFTAFLLYGSSATLHALPEGPARDRFEVLDHIAIFLLIAGTYTPFTVGVLHGVWGISILGLIWSLAAIGIVTKLIQGPGRIINTTWLYVAMGWVILVAVRPLVRLMPLPGLLLMLAGGLSYTAGVGFFLARRMRFNHLIWHLFVLGGTSFHYFAILNYSGSAPE